ncbi:MAG: uncharacterized protein KVP18_000791 [Porospora cf. gigantea A]|uniref:uncharacterized protein n=1 Tax=Porospora cf. gigantea A TaxID=2853593 RepID=UPI00355A5178|nr:MAG: hypothetical protein KVP18_000791 [Porospora cf. gigantea A]
MFERPDWSWDDIIGMSPISKAQQRHLTNVYACLAWCVLLAMLGCALDVLAGIPSLLNGLLHMAGVFYLMSTANQGFNTIRAVVLSSVSLLMGVSVQELVFYADIMNPQIVPRAFLASFAIFAAFTLTSFFTRRRQALYLGALLSTVVSYMTLAGLANLFLQWPLIQDGLLWVGLFSFVGFVVYDTQLILMSVEAGRADVLSNALMLFVDIFAVFVRLVVILLDKQRRREDEERKRR